MYGGIMGNQPNLIEEVIASGELNEYIPADAEIRKGKQKICVHLPEDTKVTLFCIYDFEDLEQNAEKLRSLAERGVNTPYIYNCKRIKTSTGREVLLVEEEYVKGKTASFDNY